MTVWGDHETEARSVLYVDGFGARSSHVVDPGPLNGLVGRVRIDGWWVYYRPSDWQRELSARLGSFFTVSDHAADSSAEGR